MKLNYGLYGGTQLLKAINTTKSGAVTVAMSSIW